MITNVANVMSFEETKQLALKCHAEESIQYVVLEQADTICTRKSTGETGPLLFVCDVNEHTRYFHDYKLRYVTMTKDLGDE